MKDKPTKRYRELLRKQREEIHKAFTKLFLSFEVILDNVDQLHEKKEAEENIKKPSNTK